MQEAHLGKKVEVVVTHDDQIRLFTRDGPKESRADVFQCGFQCGIEIRHRNSLFTQNGRSQQRLQGRIRLHPRLLFRVGSDVIRVRQKNPRRQHVTTSDSSRCASTLGFGGATRRAAHCLNLRSMG